MAHVSNPPTKPTPLQRFFFFCSLLVSSFECLVGGLDIWLVGLLGVWFVGWIFSWSVVCLVCWLAGCLVVRLDVWFVQRCLVGCLVHSLMFGLLVGLLVGWMFVGWLDVCWLVGCLVDSVMFAISLARLHQPARFYPKAEIYVARCLCPNVINDFHSLNHKRKIDSPDRNGETK